VEEEKAMPEKADTENPYGYDARTNTVQVGQHDLDRLLLMFRTPMREQEPGRWKHMHDFNLFFERLADAVDATAEVRQDKRWSGPDLRMRCTTTEAAYTWPNGVLYDGGTPLTGKASCEASICDFVPNDLSVTVVTYRYHRK
jgi:hypothetical protein